jgi:hypothetical protein
MKNVLQVVIFTGLLSVCCAAQQPAGDSTTGTTAMEAGTVLYAELSKTVDAKKAKPGDVVTAQLMADVVSHGKIVFRRDTKLVGRVTEVQAYTRDNNESRLGFVIEKIMLKGGEEVPFRSILLAIRPAPRITIDAPSAPSPPGVNPASGPPPDKHYPSPKTTTPRFNPSMSGELKARDQEMSGMGVATDIEDLALTPGGTGKPQAVICFKHNVKLESGVRLELRVMDVPR